MKRLTKNQLRLLKDQPKLNEEFNEDDYLSTENDETEVRHYIEARDGKSKRKNTRRKKSS